MKKTQMYTIRWSINKIIINDKFNWILSLTLLLYGDTSQTKLKLSFLLLINCWCKEIYASDNGGENWKTNQSNNDIPLWWVLYMIIYKWVHILNMNRHSYMCMHRLDTHHIKNTQQIQYNKHTGICNQYDTYTSHGNIYMTTI